MIEPSASQDLRDSLDTVLSRLADPFDEARSAFVSIDATRARRQATELVATPSPRVLPHGRQGVLLSIKDLFDVVGEVSSAGSRARASLAPATSDAPAVARLIAAGCVAIGRTTMTELAYSGVGMNPHHGTPKNPWDRAAGRVPGGSSAGAAVSVADGVCDLALASDTGGSIRIPAALCGVIGFKPTARRIPREGVVPLSPSFDSVGPISRSIDLVSWADAVLSGEPDPMSALFRDRRESLRGLVLGVPDRHVFDPIDPYVAEVFWREIRRIESLGVSVRTVPMPVLDQLAEIQAIGGIPGYEAARLHAPFVALHRDRIDPRVVQRIDAAAAVSERDYEAIVAKRAAFIDAFWASLEGVDALVMPTVPIVAPRIDSLSTDEAFFKANRLLLRNTSVINVADGCAISLPCHTPGEAPVGLSLASRPMSDRSLIAIAQAMVASR